MVYDKEVGLWNELNRGEDVQMDRLQVRQAWKGKEMAVERKADSYAFD